MFEVIIDLLISGAAILTIAGLILGCSAGLVYFSGKYFNRLERIAKRANTGSMSFLVLFAGCILYWGSILGVFIAIITWPHVLNIGLWWRWQICHCAGTPPYF